MDAVERAWLAGLLEGEGCFDIEKHPTHGRPRIRIGMADKDVMERAAALMGSGLRTITRGANKPLYEVRIRDGRAEALMIELHPLLGARRQARIAELLGQSAMLMRSGVEQSGSSPGS